MSGCPRCRRKGRVTDSRARRRVHGIRRRRECLVCETRWTTWEVEWNVERVVELLEVFEQNQLAIRRALKALRSIPATTEDDQHDAP